jgi:NAD(P)-dependent dehydrogenase (short-subunit alcohol dehydrogenase family)
VTGANTGVGKDLVQILYSKNAIIYMAARSMEKASRAMEEIKANFPFSKGKMILIQMDLADLSTIKESAQQILDQESKIHVLFNNAGVFMPPGHPKSAQGYELHIGVHNVGHFLLTKLLTPTLVRTAKEEAPGTVRVVWVGSSLGEHWVVPDGGIQMDNLDYQKIDRYSFTRYGISKAGMYLQSTEMAKRYRDEGIVSIAMNPGNLRSHLWRHQTSFINLLADTFILYPTLYGAYAELFTGLSPDVTMAKSGEWSRFYIISLYYNNSSLP